MLRKGVKRRVIPRENRGLDDDRRRDVDGFLWQSKRTSGSVGIYVRGRAFTSFAAYTYAYAAANRGSERAAGREERKEGKGRKGKRKKKRETRGESCKTRDREEEGENVKKGWRGGTGERRDKI